MIFESMLLFLSVLTVAALAFKDLVQAVILIAAADCVLAFLFILMAAPDIALTQAAVCAGISTVIYMIAIHKTRRHEDG